ncbi:MAG TPA: histidine phosphatase family protein [Steroidobacteraceae bacterium]|nr:histidine phosphatase family protein [Steroidobacteraceae bacterium]
MKRLTLMRHGNAEWKDPEVPDFDRTLSRRGSSEAEVMARRLSELGLVPTLLLVSPARRAQQTADIVVRELGIPPRHLRSQESLYLAEAQDILGVVSATGPRIPHLMIVGHNPGLSEVVRLLSRELPAHELGTGAVCSLTFDARTWSAVDAANLRETQCETPVRGLFRMFA